MKWRVITASRSAKEFIWWQSAALLSAIGRRASGSERAVGRYDS
ncbi:hypothetical protein [Priestia filamentosa]|nr:hypothetical protein [Priestia filamentosa]MDT3766032.1 hypothetical protein [Priestia filamentosa]WCM16029.1 hypothetical protein PGN40_01180 [Priestia filamentosa]